MTKRYTVVIERGESSYGAYIPDLPGCVAVATTRKEVERLIREAIVLHLEAMLQHGDPIPEPTSRGLEVEVDLSRVSRPARRPAKRA